jgi:serine/threonine-protein kinase HipA
MKKSIKCLYCYNSLTAGEIDYHEKCCRKIFGVSKSPLIDITPKDIDKLASDAINRSLAVPGVQKKLSLELKKTGKGARLTIVGSLGGYILKPATEEYPGLPENEDLTMHLAEICGIETALHALIRFQTGEMAYITKRFDREGNFKIPVEDMNQLTGNLTSDKYSGSIERISKLIYKYCTYNFLEIIKFFKSIVFCYITGNADMHLKNFSIMKGKDGIIKLTPAYDLLSTKLVIPEDLEESALSINGKKKKLNTNDFNLLAKYFMIEDKVKNNILNEFREKFDDMNNFIDRSFLSSDMKIKYKNMLSENAGKINLIK